MRIFEIAKIKEKSWLYDPENNLYYFVYCIIDNIFFCEVGEKIDKGTYKVIGNEIFNISDLTKLNLVLYKKNL